MGSVLVLGLLIGMRHALEADHIAAVASLTARARGLREALRIGLAWGLGHTLTLFAAGLLVLSLDSVVPERVAGFLELAVGLMLVLLGADLLRRLVTARIHFHAHRHRDGTVHFHAHSHAGEGAHVASAHDHVHRRGMVFRALVVGLVHGMAGSAALILLTAGEIESLGMALAFVALFGFGSMVGMAVLSVAIALPLQRLAKSLTRVYTGLTAAVAIATVGLGAWVSYRVGVVDGLLVG